MPDFALKDLKASGGRHKIYALVVDSSCNYDQFIDEYCKVHAIEKSGLLDNKKIAAKELKTILATVDILSTGGAILPDKKRNLQKSGGRLNVQYPCFEIRYKRIRVYIADLRPRGYILVSAQFSKTDKDQKKHLTDIFWPIIAKLDKEKDYDITAK